MQTNLMAVSTTMDIRIKVGFSPPSGHIIIVLLCYHLGLDSMPWHFARVINVSEYRLNYMSGKKLDQSHQSAK